MLLGELAIAGAVDVVELVEELAIGDVRRDLVAPGLLVLHHEAVCCCERLPLGFCIYLADPISKACLSQRPVSLDEACSIKGLVSRRHVSLKCLFYQRPCLQKASSLKGLTSEWPHLSKASSLKGLISMA